MSVTAAAPAHRVRSFCVATVRMRWSASSAPNRLRTAPEASVAASVAAAGSASGDTTSGAGAISAAAAAVAASVTGPELASTGWLVSSDIEIANRPPMKHLEYLVFRRVLSGQWHHAHGSRWARKGSLASGTLRSSRMCGPWVTSPGRPATPEPGLDAVTWPRGCQRRPGARAQPCGSADRLCAAYAATGARPYSPTP